MSQLNPAQPIIRVPPDIVRRTPLGAPPDSVEEAVLSGSETAAGQYLVLMKWHPGFWSAPHFYRTDRLCMVLSGVWWCNSGPDFDPGQAVAAPAGSFVHRVAGTPHYDGAHSDAAAPAVIAVTGIGPVEQTWVHPSEPPLRAF